MESRHKSESLIKTGAETFGAAIGGAIGLLGGPGGAIGGSIAGVLISKGILEVSNRFLSNREQARVGAAAGMTILSIEENLQKGLPIRQDSFFDSKENNRSKAEELFEGVLIKCKNEFEEKKIKFLSNIYKNVAFDESMNPENAIQVLNVVEQFSYRVLAILALVGQNSNNSKELRNRHYSKDIDILSNELDFLLQDFVTLAKHGLIMNGDNMTVLDSNDINPGGMKLTPMGSTYFRILELNKLELNKLEFINLLKN